MTPSLQLQKSAPSKYLLLVFSALLTVVFLGMIPFHMNFYVHMGIGALAFAAIFAQDIVLVATRKKR